MSADTQGQIHHLSFVDDKKKTKKTPKQLFKFDLN